MITKQLLATADGTDQVAETEGRVGDVGEQLQEFSVSACVAETYQGLLEQDVRNDRLIIERTAVLSELDSADRICVLRGMRGGVEVIEVERAVVSSGLCRTIRDVVAKETA